MLRAAAGRSNRFCRLDAEPVRATSAVPAFPGLGLPAGRATAVRRKRLAGELSARWIEGCRRGELGQRETLSRARAARQALPEERLAPLLLALRDVAGIGAPGVAVALLP